MYSVSLEGICSVHRLAAALGKLQAAYSVNLPLSRLLTCSDKGEVSLDSRHLDQVEMCSQNQEVCLEILPNRQMPLDHPLPAHLDSRTPVARAHLVPLHHLVPTRVPHLAALQRQNLAHSLDRVRLATPLLLLQYSALLPRPATVCLDNPLHLVSLRALGSPMLPRSAQVAEVLAPNPLSVKQVVQSSEANRRLDNREVLSLVLEVPVPAEVVFLVVRIINSLYKILCVNT